MRDAYVGSDLADVTRKTPRLKCTPWAVRSRYWFSVTEYDLARIELGPNLRGNIEWRNDLP